MEKNILQVEECARMARQCIRLIRRLATTKCTKLIFLKNISEARSRMKRTKKRQFTFIDHDVHILRAVPSINRHFIRFAHFVNDFGQLSVCTLTTENALSTAAKNISATNLPSNLMIIASCFSYIMHTIDTLSTLTLAFLTATKAI